MSHGTRYAALALFIAYPWLAVMEGHGSDAREYLAVASAAESNLSSSSHAPRLPIRFAEADRLAVDPLRGRETGVPTVARPDPMEVRAADRARVEQPLPLSPPRQAKSPNQKPAGRPAASRTLTTALGSLGLVLAVFFVLAWATRRHTPKGLALLPAEVVESLGRAPLAGRQQMQLIRVGRKLVLLVVTAAGTRPLTEITDPLEVDRLAGLCQQNHPGSISATFRQVLAQCATEPPPQETPGGSPRSSAAGGMRAALPFGAREGRHA